jgi:hypothetical protein
VFTDRHYEIKLILMKEKITMSLTQLILANAAVAMIIGMSIVVLAITALEVHESGFNKKALENLEPVYQLYAFAVVAAIILLH